MYRRQHSLRPRGPGFTGFIHYMYACVEPHTSVGSVQDLRTESPLSLAGQSSLRGLMIISATGFTPLLPLTAVHRFGNGYVGKQPVAWKKYCKENWLKELRAAWKRTLAAAI